MTALAPSPRSTPAARSNLVRPTWRLPAAILAGALPAVAVSLAMPRGPVTAGQALVLMVLGTAVGLGAGVVLRSRWAMLAAPAAYVLAFEVGTGGSAGPTVDAIHLDSTWGIFALFLGRGFHGLVALAPMIVAAAVGAALARRRSGAPPPDGAWAWIRRVTTAAAMLGLVLLAVQIARPASTPAIRGADGSPLPGSVAELVEVNIGGVEQWLSIRGHSTENPVLLYLPGGPGQSDMALSRVLLADLTRDFVVVTLDGRGVGKAYPSFDPATLTTDRVVQDVVDVTNHLRRRFDERRIYLFGESGGTVTGVLAVQRHPELYHAWLGSGQMVSVRETDRRIYRDLMAYAGRNGDHGLAAKLREYAEPPYDTPYANAFVMGYYDKLAGEYDPPSAYVERGERAKVGFFGIMGSEYALVEKVNALRGLMDTFFTLYPQWQAIDFRRSAARFAVPVYLFTGDHELAGRRDLTLQWFEQLRAPRKRLYSFSNAGHATAFEHADAFRRILREQIVPATYGAR